MRKTFLGLFTTLLLLGFAALSYSEMVVSLKQDTDVALPKIKVDIHLADGQGVAGYNLFLVYDPSVLKYVDTIHGDYLPTGGLFLRPALGQNDTYELQLSIDATTTTGQSVVFGEGEAAETLLLSDFFFSVPDPTESEPLSGVSNDDGASTLITPDLKYQAISVLRSAPLAADGDGTLTSLSFDVLNPDMPMVVHLVGITLFGADDTDLHATLENNVATFKKRTSDVNADGVVNILDLTGVAAAFGAPITTANRHADVTADGEINILDLVQVANDFGSDPSVVSVVYTTQLTELLVDTSVGTDTGSVGQSTPSEPGFSEEIPPDLGISPYVHMNVGLVMPLSGHLAETGEIMKTGFEFAFKEHFGFDGTARGDIAVSYVIVDDKGTAEGAVAAFEELIHTHGVSVILGPGSSSSTRAAFPIAEENEVVAISATAGARGLGAIGDFVFRVALTTDIVIPKAVAMTKRKMGYQRVATLYDETDLFSTDRDAALQQAFIDNNVEVLGTQTYTTGTTDFTPQLRRIKALNPDALFVSALPPEKPEILIQARELGLNVPILISSLTDAEVEAAGIAAEGALTFTGWLSTDSTPGNRAFVERYQATYGTTPNAFAAVSYACVHIFAEALNNAAATDAHSIRDALSEISELDTILGKFSFNADGDAVYEPNVLIVRNGMLRAFD